MLGERNTDCACSSQVSVLATEVAEKGQFGIMSRRKQANPRSIQVVEDKNGADEESNKLVIDDQKEPELMDTLQPLNIDINLPYNYNTLSSSLSNSEDNTSRVPSPSENPQMITSPSTPSSTCSSVPPTSDLPLPKLKDATKILPIPGSDGRTKYVCPMCQEHLESNHDLTVHIRMHNSGNQTSQNNTCTICNKILSSQSSLDRHMLVHSGERPFKCKICSMTFTTNGNMHRHSRIHQKQNNGTDSPRPSKRGKGGWKGKLFSSSSLDDSDASHKNSSDLLDESRKLSKSSAATFDWSTDLHKPSILPKSNKIMPAFMPRPVWPAYSPYMPFMRPPFPQMYPDLSMGMFPFQQQIPCPLCSKMVNLVEYMTHLKIEHDQDSPFTPSKVDSSPVTTPIKEEVASEVEEQSPDQSDNQSDNQDRQSENDNQSDDEENRLEIEIDQLDDIKEEMDKSDESDDSTSPPKSGAKEIKDINFMDFSSQKFPLVAKAWCEENEEATTNTSDFICKECGKAFPCKSSLMLHADSHLESRSFETSDIQTEETTIKKSGEKTKKGFFSMLELKPNQSDIPSNNDKTLEIKLEKMEDEDEEQQDRSSPETSPPKQPSDFNPFSPFNYLKPSFLPFNVSNMALNVQRGMLHADSPFTTSTSPASSVVSGEGNGNVADLHDTKATGLLCKFCDMVFPNQKTLNAHKRIHMGLSPYKCSMCNYSSADKSTLIRHFRTHNGERPFQCTICDYAFTTKANCERHVRKKHGKNDKSEIEKSIGYNKYSTTTADIDKINTFHSPDTVCKYCGEDFKFFRALKHHLRSHTSCRLKPFLCQKCQVGFSTRANCVRHIQKQHVDINTNEIEDYIQVNDTNTVDMDSDSSTSDKVNYKVSPKNQTESPSPVVTESLLKHMMGKIGSPSPYKLSSTLSTSSTLYNDDQPIDLSVKKSPVDNKISPKQTEISSKMMYNCPYCLKSFNIRSELVLHVQQVHDITPEKDTNNNKKWLQESAAPRKLPVIPYPIHPAFAKYPYPNQAISALFSHRGFDMTSDLSPVNRMLNTAQSPSFRNFLNLSPDKRKATSTSSVNNDHDEDSDDFSEDNSVDKSDPYENTARLDNSYQHNIRKHKTDDSGEPPVKKKRNSYADSPHKLACPYCPRSFPWVSSLNRHLLTHTGQKPFKCSQCPVTFSTKSNRERHLIRKHGVNMLDPASRSTMDRPYKCHLCVFSSFATRSNLEKHYSERHPNCEIPLDNLYNDNADHTSDIDSQHNDNDNTDNLPQNEDCEAEDNYQDDNQDDIIIINPHNDNVKDNRPLSDDEDVVNYYEDTPEKHINPERDNYNVDKITQCWKCSEEFTSRKLLVRHLKEHNIDLPYKCYLCDASFDERLECLKHKEKNHSNDWLVLFEKNGVKNIDEFSSQIDNMVNKSSTVTDTEGDVTYEMLESARADVLTADYFQRKVYCSLCPKRFWSLQDLRRHMRSHTGERPFECDICFKRFTLKHSMMRHRRKHSNQQPDIDTDTFYTEDIIGNNMYSGQLPRLPFSTKQHYNTPSSTSTPVPTSTPITREEVEEKEEDNNDKGSDILQNLLGVNTTDIDSMLDFKQSLQSTTQLLGIDDDKPKTTS